ncbi:MAG: HAMP domain-containing histidine kinase [Gammaproteobacteria bacterium]|nr:HAMP domain-containing histidine kinase [Gammaproteobacteria bacterium]
MQNRSGLRHKLGRAFLLQALAIGVTAVLGVYAAGLILEEVLIKRALSQESEYFWRHYAKNPAFPRPDTLNLTGYLVSDGDVAMPTDLLEFGDGFHDVNGIENVSETHISTQDGEKLILLFDGKRVRDLSFYFGLVPLAAVLSVIYLLTWLSYRFSHRAVSSIIWLAHEVQQLDPAAPDPSIFGEDKIPENSDQEVVALSNALSRFAIRLNEFVDRERNFTRDASHELRSPLTVIKLASDMLLSEEELSKPAQNSVKRVKAAAADMEELVEAFLLLARESGDDLELEDVCVNDIIHDELERAQILFKGKKVKVSTKLDHRLVTRTSDKAVSVVIGNLLRNAFSYTDEGLVEIETVDRLVIISDTGEGMTDTDVDQAFRPYFRGKHRKRGGHGVGLTIVKRFADRFGWIVSIDSKLNIGTRIVVEFPTSPRSDVALET